MRRRGLPLALLMLCSVHCMLLLDEEPELTEHCSFLGAENACGACIADSCQRPVDDCCEDASCRAVLSTLDTCATVHGLACSVLANHTGSDAAGDLARCVEAACALVCPKGVSLTDCTLFTDESSCYCSADDAEDANDELCNTSVVENSVCCADLGWPGRDLRCSCERFGCSETTDGCSCSIYSGGPNPSCHPAGTLCCAGGTTCNCGSEPCIDGIEVPVESCTADVVLCSSNEERVTSCSRRSE